MRPWKNDYTMDCHEVHDRVGAVVQRHVQFASLQDYGQVFVHCELAEFRACDLTSPRLWK